MPIDQNIIESARVIDDQAIPLALRLEERVKEIAQKLFPELDWDANPVEFRIGDSPNVNAHTYVDAKPPVIVIDRGLLEFVRTEDELAFVIGHEMGHKQFREKLGYEAGDLGTKTEEGAADIISILRCVKAGYNYHAALDFFRHLEEMIGPGNEEDIPDKFVELMKLHPLDDDRIEAMDLEAENFSDALGGRDIPETLSRIMQVHPLSGDRIAAVELALANENLFKSGTIRETPYTPLAGVLAEKESFYQLRHISFLDRFLPGDYAILEPAARLRWLREALEATISERRFLNIDVRSKAILDELRIIKTTPEDTEAREEVEKIIGVVVGTDRYNGKHRFDQFYIAATETLGENPPLMGPFSMLDGAIDEFLAAEPGNRQKAGRGLLMALRGVKPYLSTSKSRQQEEKRQANKKWESDDEETSRERKYIILKDRSSALYEIDSGPRESYVLPVTKAFMRLRSSFRDLYEAAHTSHACAEAIWVLGGAFDRKFWDVIGTKELNSLKTVRPYAGYTRSSDETLQDEEFKYLQAEIEGGLVQGMRLSAQENVNTFLADPTTFIFAYREELFPRRGPMPSSAVSEREQQKALYQQIRDEFSAAFKNGDRDATVEAIQTLYNAVYAWLSESGRQAGHHKSHDYVRRGKRALARLAEREGSEDEEKTDKIRQNKSDITEQADPFDLTPEHPLARLLLGAAPYLERKEFVRQLTNIVDYKKMGEKALLEALQIRQPETVAEALQMREDINALGHMGLANHIAELSMDRIVEADKALSLESGNLLALSRLHTQNREAVNIHRLLGPDAIEAIHARLWKDFSAERFAAYAQTLEADQLLDIYQFLETRHLFSEREDQKALVEMVKERIETAPPAEREHLFERLLVNQRGGGYSSDIYTVKDIALRDFAIAGYTECLKAKFGEDTGDAAYAAQVNPVIDEIIKHSLPRDRVLILESMARSFNIQAGIAQHIHDELKPTKDDVIGSHLPVMGMEAFMSAIENNEDLRKTVIDYLSDPLSKSSVEKLSEIILKDRHLVEQMTKVDFIEVRNGSVVLDKLGRDRLHEALMDMHDNFSNIEIDKKTAILSVLLIPGSARLDAEAQRIAYDEASLKVFQKVFRSGAENAAEAESFVHAFIDTAKDFERAPILAALMALSSGGGTEKKTVAEQAAQIMSLLGPAYVKLGQAINSNPGSPQDWREAMADLKSNTRIEPRWETILRVRELLSEEQAAHIIHFGPDLGSASFNSAIQVTMDDAYAEPDLVALVERPHAWTRAETGFDHLAETVDHWDHPMAARHHDTISEMISEARDVARLETDTKVGTSQYQRAQEIYGGTAIEFRDGTRLTVTPVSLHMSAEQIRLISLANGIHFSELPETTQAEIDTKKKVARAYVAFELSKILSGKGFDCDRHGRQMKVDISDPADIKLNLYDFGGLDIEEASSSAKKALGHALNQVAQGLQSGGDPVKLFEASLEEVHEPETRAHLLRARKAWLALQDFQKYVNKDEMMGVLRSALKQPVDKEIMSEFKSAKMLRMFKHGALEFQIRRPLHPGTVPPQLIRRLASAVIHK